MCVADIMVVVVKIRGKDCYEVVARERNQRTVKHLECSLKGKHSVIGKKTRCDNS